MTDVILSTLRARDWAEVAAAGDARCGAQCRDAPDLTCDRAPHDDRWHRTWGADTLEAEWSSVLPDDDDSRLWPDGHVGPRPPRGRT